MMGWANELWGGLIHDGMENPPACGWPLEVDAAGGAGAVISPAAGGAGSVIAPSAGGAGTPLSESAE